MIKEIITEIEKLDNIFSEPFSTTENISIEEKELFHKTVTDLTDTIKHDKNIVGLSAPQIGVNKQVFVLKFNDGNVRVFANPIIIKELNLQPSIESTPTIPKKKFLIPRSHAITVQYTDESGNIMEEELLGVVACIFKQQYESLYGYTLLENGLEIGSDYFRASPKDRGELFIWWLQELEKKRKAIVDDLDNSDDEEMKLVKEAIRYRESIASGETTVEFVTDLEIKLTDEPDNS